MKLYSMIACLFFCTVGLSQTAELNCYCPPMPVDKVRVGLWQARLEPCEIDITYDGLKMDAARVNRSANVANIPATYVRMTPRGIYVDACIGYGKFSDGSEFTMWLPREPVVFDHFERNRLKLKAVMVALAIDAQCQLVKANGETWEGSLRFPNCKAYPVTSRLRMAEEVTAVGSMTLVKKGK